MHYYTEEAMRDLREAFEAHVFRWPGVVSTKMFGCPCYRARGVLFAFLVTGALVLTRLPLAEARGLVRDRGAGPFAAGGKRVGAWLRVPVRGGDLHSLLPFARISYEAAIRGPRPSRTRRPATPSRDTGRTPPGTGRSARAAPAARRRSTATPTT
jgi:hypothetical protein